MMDIINSIIIISMSRVLTTKKKPRRTSSKVTTTEMAGETSKPTIASKWEAEGVQCRLIFGFRYSFKDSNNQHPDNRRSSFGTYSGGQQAENEEKSMSKGAPEEDGTQAKV